MHSDDRLVQLVRLGDDDAFAAIVARHRPKLVAFARALLSGAHHDAEEVVQDALLRALHALRADDRPIALKPWLFTIVRNRAFDQRRRPQRTTDLDHHAAYLRDGTADPHDALMRQEALGALLHDVAALPERQREALVLHEFAGVPHEAIARRLHVSAGGSKALVHRARCGLQRSREQAVAA